jgi:thiol-disulfide isomerase/thioredoxin
MVEVVEITGKSAWENYIEFRRILYSAQVDVPQAYLFEGSKECEGKSWCQFCVPVHPEFMRLARKYTGNVKFYTVEVGTLAEWKPEEWGEKNPFKVMKPNLEGVPTLEIHKKYTSDGQIRQRRFISELNPPKSLLEYILENIPTITETT